RPGAGPRAGRPAGARGPPDHPGLDLVHAAGRAGRGAERLTFPSWRRGYDPVVMPRLMIVIASTRPGRVGLPVAEWFTAVAEEHSSFDIDVADLAEINLPFMDEPKHPRLREYQHDHTRAWSSRVDRADAFVFVHPEYNFGMTAPLKNALDYLHHE